MKKNFIAGAVCPRCQKMDTIALYKEHNTVDPTLSTRQQDEQGQSQSHRRCVSCGFEDTMTDHGEMVELNTRVNKPIQPDPSVKPLIFHTPKKRSPE